MEGEGEGSNSDEQFLRLFLANQRALYAYILTLVPSIADAEDVFQEMNVTLWRIREEFTPGTNFRAWASKVAYHKVLGHRTQFMRSKLVFDEDMLGRIAHRVTALEHEL